MAEKTKTWIRELFRETIASSIGGGIREFLSKGPQMASERIEKLIKENPRAGLLQAIMLLAKDEPELADKFWARHLGAIETGTENSFVRALGDALPRDKDGRIDVEKGREFLKQIFQMDEAKFCQVLEEMSHDPIAQHFRRWVREGRSFAEALLEAIAYTSGVAARKGEDIDAWAEQKAQQINQRVVDNPGWYGRLAKTIFR